MQNSVKKSSCQLTGTLPKPVYLSRNFFLHGTYSKIRTLDNKMHTRVLPHLSYEAMKDTYIQSAPAEANGIKLTPWLLITSVTRVLHYKSESLTTSPARASELVLLTPRQMTALSLLLCPSSSYFVVLNFHRGRLYFLKKTKR